MPGAQAVADIVDILRDFDPDVIVSLDRDGAYGHLDHVALWEYTRLALASLMTNAPERRRRWLAAIFPRDLFLLQWRCMTAGPDAASVSDEAPDLGSEVAAVDLRLAVEDPGRKRASIGSHRSQLTEGTPESLFPPGVVDAVLCEEWYRLALGPALVEVDPFSGLS
jgi:LmbE family N-acetylglucosaminyl deacetylase